MRRAAALLLLAALASGARAQDGEEVRVLGGDRGTLRVEVRGRPTLTQPGDAVQDARLAWIEEGESAVEAAPRAVRTDAAGRAELRVPEGGGVLLLWKDGLAPVAHWFARGGDRRLHLVDAGHLEGGVIGPLGDPIPGAALTLEVELPVIGAPERGPRVHAFARTLVADDAGRFRFEGLPDAPGALRGDADGWVTATLFPVRPDGSLRTVVLGRGAAVSGSVSFLPGGGPAAGVVVSVAGRETTVADDGTFEVETIPPGVHQLFVEGSGFVPPAPRRLVLKEGRRRSGIVLELLEGATFEGALRDVRGRPVASATFRFVFPPLATGPGGLSETPTAEREFVREIETDEAGRFRVTELLPAEGVTLEVRTEAFVPLVVEGIALRPGEVARPADLVLSAGGVLGGQVVGAGGEPVEGADVEAYVADSPQPEPVRVVTTDALGSFVLRGVPSGSTALEVRPPSSGLERPGTFGPFEARDTELVRVGVLRLDPGHVLRGRVEGAPETATVRAFVGEELVSEAPLERGVFELRGLASGAVTLEVTAIGAGGLAAAEAIVPSKAPAYLVWLDAKRIVGWVKDDRGAAVTEAHLVVEPAPDPDAEPERDRGERPTEPPLERDLRDAEGRFEVDVLPGRWRITASTEDGRFGSTEVVIRRFGDAERVTLTLATGESVQGHLVDAESGAPLEGARVRALPVAGAHEASSPEAVSDDRGFFRVPGVTTGMVRLRIEAEGYAPHETEPLSVRRAAAPYVGRIEIEPGVRVLGRITTRGRPVPGATVLLEDDDGYRRSARTDLHGRYEISGMSVGSAVLWVQTPDRAPQRALRVLIRMRVEGFELDADLDDGTRIVGLVTAHGRPEPHAEIVAWTFGGTPTAAEVRTDAHGRFTLPPLPPGEVRVAVQTAGSRVAHEYDIELPDAYEHLVDIELPEASVSGNVIVEEGGAAVSGAFVSLVSSDAEGEPRRQGGDSVTDVNGRFQMDGVAPGVYVLEVSRKGYGTVAVEGVEVTERDVLDGIRLEMPREASVVLGVRDMRNNPIPGARLEARRTLPGGAEQVRRARADGRGIVRLGGLAPDDWAISVHAPGFAWHHDFLRYLDPGPNALNDVALERGSLLRVRVVGALLAPVSGVVVHVEDIFGFDPRGDRRPDDRLRGGDRAYVTDARGEVLISSLSPGSYAVWVDGAEDDDVIDVRVGDTEVKTVFLFAP